MVCYRCYREISMPVRSGQVTLYKPSWLGIQIDFEKFLKDNDFKRDCMVLQSTLLMQLFCMFCFHCHDDNQKVSMQVNGTMVTTRVCSLSKAISVAKPAFSSWKIPCWECTLQFFCAHGRSIY